MDPYSEEAAVTHFKDYLDPDFFDQMPEDHGFRNAASIAENTDCKEQRRLKEAIRYYKDKAAFYRKQKTAASIKLQQMRLTQ